MNGHWTIKRAGVALCAVAVAALIVPTGEAASRKRIKKTDDPPKIKVTSDNPVSGDPAAIKQGRKLFNTFCAQCHGPKANGISPRFGNYAADLRRFSKGYFEFVGIVVEGRVKKKMPPWGEYLDGDQISAIGAYLETLAVEGAVWSTEN